VLLLAGVAGCVIVGDPSCPTGGATIVVTPEVLVVTVGQSVTPSASDSWCQNGHTSYGSPTWSLAQPGDSAIVRLNAATGTITGLRVGQATVTARSAASGASAAIAVTVR
jgi:hypothetical protein